MVHWLLVVVVVVPELRKVNNRPKTIVPIRGPKPSLAKVVFLSLPQVLGNVGIGIGIAVAAATTCIAQTVGMRESQRM